MILSEILFKLQDSIWRIVACDYKAHNYSTSLYYTDSFSDERENLPNSLMYFTNQALFFIWGSIISGVFHNTNFYAESFLYTRLSYPKVLDGIGQN